MIEYPRLPEVHVEAMQGMATAQGEFNAMLKCPDCGTMQRIDREQAEGQRAIQCQCGYRIKTRLV